MNPLVASNLKLNLHLVFRYSFYITLSYVIYFIIARITGLAYIVEFRFLNYLFAFILCYFALKNAWERDHVYYLEYFTGLSIGILTVAIGQLWYAVLFFIYLNIDYKFLAFLLSETPRDVISPSFSMSVMLFLEGFGASPIIALILMQYFKWTRPRWTNVGVGS